MAGLTDGYSGALIDFHPDATVVVDASGTVIAWSRAMEEMTSVPGAAPVGRGHLQLFGEERLQAVVREHAAEPAAAMIDAVLAAVDEVATGEPQSDDMTVMVIRGV